MSRSLEDLVLGELQQLSNKKEKTDRFNTYLQKTYNKTASIMANSCQAVAQMAAASTASHSISSEYPLNIYFKTIENDLNIQEGTQCDF